jgi:hypothetical protein
MVFFCHVLPLESFNVVNSVTFPSAPPAAIKPSFINFTQVTSLLVENSCMPIRTRVEEAYATSDSELIASARDSLLHAENDTGCVDLNVACWVVTDGMFLSKNTLVFDIGYKTVFPNQMKILKLLVLQEMHICVCTSDRI